MKYERNNLIWSEQKTEEHRPPRILMSGYDLTKARKAFFLNVLWRSILSITNDEFGKGGWMDCGRWWRVSVGKDTSKRQVRVKSSMNKTECYGLRMDEPWIQHKTPPAQNVHHRKKCFLCDPEGLSPVSYPASSDVTVRSWRVFLHLAACFFWLARSISCLRPFKVKHTQIWSTTYTNSNTRATGDRLTWHSVFDWKVTGSKIESNVFFFGRGFWQPCIQVERRAVITAWE